MRTDAIKNRHKIFHATSTLLAQTDRKQITMEQIARQAGVGIGTLYRNFPTKDDLFIALAYHQLDEYLDAYETKTQEKKLNRQTIRDILYQYIVSREKRQRLLPTGSLESTLRSYKRPNYLRLHKFFANLISNYTESLTKQTVDFQADALILCLRSDNYYLQRNMRNLTINQILDQVMNLFFPSTDTANNHVK